MRIIWLGQAGFVLQSGGGALAVDPYCGQPPDGSVRLYDPIVPKGWKEVDIAVSTHDHWDHFDVQTYEEYVIPKAIAGPGSCMKRLRASALKDKTEAIPLDCGDTVDRCGFRLTAVYASHDRDSIGVLVECEGATLYFSGDTLFVPMLLMMNRFKPDIAFICINGKMGNM
ncbi:MAG: MBL fold metallo-hydrolase, partial [Peptococcaceae bacterium]|nr:MBL fold metallo-hydrolase [Peptococcaceae bacterium]